MQFDQHAGLAQLAALKVQLEDPEAEYRCSRRAHFFFTPPVLLDLHELYCKAQGNPNLLRLPTLKPSID